MQAAQELCINGLVVLAPNPDSNWEHRTPLERGVMPTGAAAGTEIGQTDPTRNWRDQFGEQIKKVFFPRKVEPVEYQTKETPDRLQKIVKKLIELGISVDESEAKIDLKTLELAHDPAYLDALQILSANAPQDGSLYTLGPDVLTFKQLRRVNTLRKIIRNNYNSSNRMTLEDLEKRTKIPRDKIIEYLQLIFSTDSFAPVNKATYREAVRSAALMHKLAEKALEELQSRENGQDPDFKVGVALCRPSNHHAFKDAMGGYCYLNNSAVAAKYLASQGKRVVILDVDYHHGNGTQAICYDDPNILTISIHCDESVYPFSGKEDETGDPLKAPNTNLNIIVPNNATYDQDYAQAYQIALDATQAFSPDVIIFDFGADTHEQEPYENERHGLTYEDYRRMGSQIALLAKQMNAPLLIELLGGYNPDTLPESFASMLAGVLTTYN